MASFLTVPVKNYNARSASFLPAGVCGVIGRFKVHHRWELITVLARHSELSARRLPIAISSESPTELAIEQSTRLTIKPLFPANLAHNPKVVRKAI